MAKHGAVYLLLLLCVVLSAHAKFVIVGQRNAAGFTYPWNPATNYTKWQSQFAVRPKDHLVFEYSNGAESVYELPSLESLQSCDMSAAVKLCDSHMGVKQFGCIVSLDDRIRFITSSEEHCKMGQQVMVAPLTTPPPFGSIRLQGVPESPLWVDEQGQDNASAVIKASAATIGAAPVNNAAAVNGPRKIVVGFNAPSYNYPFNPRVSYTSWLSKTNIYAGDKLVFQYPPYTETVVQFTNYDAYASCNYAYSSTVCYDNWGTFCFVQATANVAYYGSGTYGHCMAGQKVAVKGGARPYVPRTLVVGYPSQTYAWNWNPQANLQTWVANNPVYVGDTLVFKYPKFKDEVYIVPTRYDFDNCIYKNYISYCNETDGSGAGCYSNPITQTSYFISGIYQACMKLNEKIMVVPKQHN